MTRGPTRRFRWTKQVLYYRRELHIGLQAVWFLKIPLRAEAVDVSAIRLRCCGGHHDNRSFVARRVLSKPPQHFEAGNFRQVQIQKYQCGTVIASVLLQIPQRVLPIAGGANAEIEPALLHHLPDHEDVRRVILDEQYGASLGPD